MELEKEYYAFISYKSEDVEWAIWLQHELEHYHLPTSFNGRTDIRRDLRPVFRDIDELSAGNLPNQIRHALINSQNLIVVCSPKAAASPWVNQEIETFISIGKTNRIFPFIVEGSSPKDYFPPALLSLPKNQERLGGEVSKNGRDSAFVKVVAGMLGLGFDTLWNRYEKEKAEEERHAREQRDNLLRLKSRFISEKANDLIKDGNSYIARKLLLEVLPSDVEADIPLTIEAELSLREAMKHDSVTISEHTEQVNSVSFSPDGRLIVSASDDKTIRLWDVKTGKQICSPLIGHTGIVKSASFSPDGKLIVSYSDDNSIRLWDAITGEQIGLPLVAHATMVISDYKEDWNNDDFESFFLGKGEKTAMDKEKRIKKSVEKTSHEHHLSYIASINSASFSPNGERIISASENVIRIWDVATRKQIGQPLVGHTNTVNSAFYNSDGTRIISASDDKTIRIWDAVTEKQLGEPLVGHTGGVEYASFSPEGNEIVSASRDNTVRIWDITNGQHKKIRHTMAEYATYSHDGKFIISVGGGKVRLIDASTKKKIRESLGTTAAISKGSTYIISAYYENGIKLSELFKKNTVKTTLGSHCKDAYYAIFSPDGKTIASASSDKLIKLWDSETGALKNSLKNDSYIISHLSFCPNGLLLLISSWGLDVDIWDLKNKTKKVLGRHSSSVSSAVFSPDGKKIISASMDGVIKEWDILTGEQLGKPMDAYTNKMYSDVVVAYCPDGSQFLSVGGEGIIKIWDSNTYEQIGDSIKGRAANYSTDGKYLVSANHKTICIWDVYSRTPIREYANNEQFGDVTTVSFSPNGKYLLYATNHGEIGIRDIATGRIMENWFIGIEKSVRSVFFSPDNRSVLSASEDGFIRIWSFPSLEELINDTRRRFKDNPLTVEEQKKYYLV